MPTGGSLLEVGSGALGLGEFWPGSFVGCDIDFTSRPGKRMRAVKCSGHQLPFGDSSFDGVVASDVIEHVPPLMRQQVVQEVLRVARRIAVFGYPCGPEAFALDQKLYREFEHRGLPRPQWLEEHMLHAFPDENLLCDLPTGWKKCIIPNESLDFHYWMMTMEMFRPWDYSFRLALLIMPRLVARFLQRVNEEPTYRKIFVLTRTSSPTYA